MNIIIAILYLLPKNLISFAVGKLSSIKLPAGIAQPILSFLVKALKIDMSDAEKPLSSYDSFLDLFTRKLKEGTRPIESSVVSPADGTLAISEPCYGLTTIQAKGYEYSVGQLVYGSYEKSDAFDPAWALTVYLAPKNYHRVHTPISGSLRKIRYLPGELWPVNPPFVKSVQNLFARNERLVFDIELPSSAMVHVVMVGAINVGRIKAKVLDDFFTNDRVSFSGGKPREFDIPQERSSLKEGDELGTFLLGSTVVCVFPRALKDTVEFVDAAQPRPIKMGETLIVE